jgi:hypothetical protein
MYRLCSAAVPTKLSPNEIGYHVFPKGAASCELCVNPGDWPRRRVAGSDVARTGIDALGRVITFASAEGVGA